jgi:hypothetical protein
VETIPFNLLQPGHVMDRTWLVPLVLIAGACAGSHPAETPAPTAGTTTAITPADLRRREYIFADDSMRAGGLVPEISGETPTSPPSCNGWDSGPQEMRALTSSGYR